MEYFWDEPTGRLTLLEVNPRHAQSHAWLFEQVDGITSVHLRVLVGAGDRLSELPLQEPFSYELAQVFVAADDEAELVATYRRAVEAMGIVVDHHPEAGLRPRWHLALP